MAEKRQIPQDQVIPSLINARLLREQTPIAESYFREWDSPDLPEQLRRNLLTIAWETWEKAKDVAEAQESISYPEWLKESTDVLIWPNEVMMIWNWEYVQKHLIWKQVEITDTSWEKRTITIESFSVPSDAFNDISQDAPKTTTDTLRKIWNESEKGKNMWCPLPKWFKINWDNVQWTPAFQISLSSAIRNKLEKDWDTLPWDPSIQWLWEGWYPNRSTINQQFSWNMLFMPTSLLKDTKNRYFSKTEWERDWEPKREHKDHFQIDRINKIAWWDWSKEDVSEMQALAWCVNQMHSMFTHPKINPNRSWDNSDVRLFKYSDDNIARVKTRDRDGDLLHFDSFSDVSVLFCSDGKARSVLGAVVVAELSSDWNLVFE